MTSGTDDLKDLSSLLGKARFSICVCTSMINHQTYTPKFDPDNRTGKSRARDELFDRGLYS